MNAPAWRATVSAALMISFLLFGCARQESATDCAIDSGPCVKDMGEGVSVSLDITPKPVKTMTDSLFTVVLKKGDVPLTGAGVTCELSMPGMYMAHNTVKLRERGEGVFEGRCVIVRCASGRKVWRAGIVVEHPGGKPSEADFTFRVGK